MSQSGSNSTAGLDLTKHATLPWTDIFSTILRTPAAQEVLQQHFSQLTSGSSNGTAKSAAATPETGKVQSFARSSLSR
jgi:hypothetical protein